MAASDIRKYGCEHTIKIGFNFRATGGQERPLAPVMRASVTRQLREPSVFSHWASCTYPASELRHVLVEPSRSFHQKRGLGRNDRRGEL